MPSFACFHANAAPSLLQRLLRVLTVGGCALLFALAGALACWQTLLHVSGERLGSFGTGCSSLAYLAQLDVHALKIDRPCTSTIATDAVKVSLVPQIIELARTLGLQVVIEGVETPEQLDWLQCVDYPLFAQGWLFGRPMTAEAFRARLVDVHATGG